MNYCFLKLVLGRRIVSLSGKKSLWWKKKITIARIMFWQSEKAALLARPRQAV
jgi:hypothetical protein